MSKVAKSFRLNPVAVEHLDELAKLTGSNQAAIVEQSLAIYRSLLIGGLSGPRRILASTTPPEVAASGTEVQSRRKRPQRPATQRLSEARGAARRAIARELAPPAPEAPAEVPLSVYQLKVSGSVFTFAFPVAEIPANGSDACPCASGKAFAQCHPEDFQKAFETGITQ
jgi:hypothetical protein